MFSQKTVVSLVKSVDSSQIIATVIIGFIVVVLLAFLKYAFRRRAFSKKMPGKPPGFFNVWGNLTEIEAARKTCPENNFNVALLRTLEDFKKTCGEKKMFCFWISYVPLVVIVGAKGVEELIAATSKKAWLYKFLHNWLGTGLLTSFGQKWKSRRKLLTPSFHFDILKEFLPTINEHAMKLNKILENETTKDFTDIVMPVTLCSLDIICETTLGVKTNTQSNQNSAYVDAVLRAATVLMERIINALYWFDSIFNLSKPGKQMKTDLKLLHGFTNSVIHEKKQKLLSGDPSVNQNRKRKALMDVLLEHHVQTKQLSEEDIREEVDTFTFEGHDTTSMGISWALFLIGHHKDVQEKLHEEMDRIFGDDNERPIIPDDLKDMTYLDRVLKESQRLYPSVPMIGREITEDAEICGYKIPKGTDCVVFTFMLHRDEEVFPDPEKFDPDRFLPENSVNRHPYAYIPFSAGSRNCIGQRFALMEEKVIISNILRRYKLDSLDSRDKMILVPELILRCLNPIRIRIRPRDSR